MNSFSWLPSFTKGNAPKLSLLFGERKDDALRGRTIISALAFTQQMNLSARDKFDD